MKIFIHILCISLCFSLVWSRRRRREFRQVETYGWKHVSGTHCTAQEYKPGQEKPIQTTTAPRATLQTTAIQAFFTHVNTGHAVGVSSIVETIAGKILLAQW